MREAVIVEGVRTPFGRRNGKLKDFHPVVLGSMVLKELVSRADIEPGQVDDVVFGCVGQVGEQSLNKPGHLVRARCRGLYLRPVQFTAVGAESDRTGGRAGELAPARQAAFTAAAPLGASTHARGFRSSI